MHFNMVNITRLHPSISEHFPDELLLCLCVRMGDGTSLGRVVGTDTLDDRLDIVAVCYGVFQTFKNEGSHSFRSTIAVGLLVEWFAGASMREEATTVKASIRIGVRDDHTTTRDGGVTLPRSQGGAGKLDGHVTRRAGSVNIHARPLPAVMIVDAAIREHSVASGDPESVHILAHVHLSVVVAGLTEVNGNPSVVGGMSTIVLVAGHFECLMDGHQEDPGHGVRLGSFARRHVEQPRIEEIRVVDETSIRNRGAVLQVAGGIVVGCEVKAGGGHLPVEVQAAAEHIPKAVEVIAAGKATSETYDCDVAGARFLRCRGRRGMECSNRAVIGLQEAGQGSEEVVAQRTNGHGLEGLECVGDGVQVDRDGQQVDDDTLQDMANCRCLGAGRRDRPGQGQGRGRQQQQAVGWQRTVQQQRRGAQDGIDEMGLRRGEVGSVPGSAGGHGAGGREGAAGAAGAAVQE